MKQIIVFVTLFLILGTLIAYFIIDKKQEPLDFNKDIREAAGGKFIQLSKGLVHYEIIGSDDKPLIILVGGGGLGYNIWDPNIDKFIQSGFRVLRYDHYGRGYSDKVNEDYSLDLYYGQFKEFLDALEIQEPFHLAGVSMGAMVAMKYTVENQNKILKLILIDPAGIHPFRAPFVLKVPVVSHLLMTFYWRPKAIQSQIEEFYKPEKFPEYRKELEKQISLKGYKKVQKSIWLNTLSIDMTDYIKQLGQLDKEIMLVWGKQDTRTRIESSKLYLESIKDIVFLPVDKAGHLSNYERPEIVNPAVIRFLKR